MWKVIGVILIVAAGIVGLDRLDVEEKVKDTNMILPKDSDGKKMVALPTAMPFVEMTVPFLKDKEYTSQMGELELWKENEGYSAYLTDYVSEGLRINALLTIPNGQKPQSGWPAVVFVHGYIPPTLYTTTKNYESYVEALARSGLMVFKIDLRGHGDSEGESSGAYYSGDYIVDVLNAREALVQSGLSERERIGLWGHSMAGNVLMRSWVARPEIKAVVIWAGAVYSYTDFSEFGIDDNSYRPPGMSNSRAMRRQEIRNLYGDPKDGHVFWQQVAPTNFLHDLDGKLQLHHASDDAVVDIEYSQNLFSLMKKAGKEVELFEYASGGHNISGSNFVVAMQRTVKFFRDNL